ncbi:hypothetical protein ACTFIW_001170 [Dictyostelium discoideum]
MDSNGIMELKESFLKAEKENEEKLNKEGVKQISNGNGYVVLSKSIDDNINMKAPPDPFVFIKMGDIVVGSISLCIGGNTYIESRCYVTPCAAFAKYIKSYPIVGTVETTIEKKKGFTTRFKTTNEINAKVSASFKGCEASLETTKTWKQTLTEGKYSVYQNVIVYAFILPGVQKNRVETLNKTNPGANVKYVPFLNGMVMFVPIYRDDPFTIHYNDFVWDPIEYNTMIGLLVENSNKWSPKTLPNQ